MKVRQIVSLFLVLSFVVSLSGCFPSDPPLQNESVNSLEKYLETNDYVKAKLQAECTGIMPTYETVADSNCTYRYEYRCQWLGDASFLLLLRADFTNPVLFMAEKNRLAVLNPSREQITDEINYYFFTDSSLSLQHYTDSYVYDGCVDRFEFVRIDEENDQIDYCIAWIQDALAPVEWIEPYICEIQSEGSSAIG